MGIEAAAIARDGAGTGAHAYTVRRCLAHSNETAQIPALLTPPGREVE